MDRNFIGAVMERRLIFFIANALTLPLPQGEETHY